MFSKCNVLHCQHLFFVRASMPTFANYVSFAVGHKPKCWTNWMRTKKFTFMVHILERTAIILRTQEKIHTAHSEERRASAKHTVACYQQLWKLSAVSICLDIQYTDTPRLHTAAFLQTEMFIVFRLNTLLEEFCGMWSGRCCDTKFPCTMWEMCEIINHIIRI